MVNGDAESIDVASSDERIPEAVGESVGSVPKGNGSEAAKRGEEKENGNEEIECEGQRVTSVLSSR